MESSQPWAAIIILFVGGVLEQLGENIVSSDVPPSWRSLAEPLFVVAVISGLGISLVLYGTPTSRGAMSGERYGFRLALLILSGFLMFLIGVTGGLLTPSLPTSFQEGIVAFAITSPFLLAFATAGPRPARGFSPPSEPPGKPTAPHNGGGVRAGRVLAALSAGQWVLWAALAGVIGSGQLKAAFDVDPYGPSPTSPELQALIVAIVMLPLAASFVSSLLTGYASSGFFAGILSATLALAITSVIYFAIYSQAHNNSNLIGSLTLGTLTGAPAGWIGGRLGAALRKG